jgi:hypothetical protein
MFRITQDPSSGSDKLYLTEIMCNGSNVLLCARSEFGGIFWTCGVCVRCVGRRNVHTHHITSHVTDNNDARGNLKL